MDFVKTSTKDLDALANLMTDFEREYPTRVLPNLTRNVPQASASIGQAIESAAFNLGHLEKVCLIINVIMMV
jgi:hypothetical protein